jgi:hydrogenase-4 component F
MYGILRYYIIVNVVLGPEFSQNLFLIFGFLSLVLATAFIIISKDYKRLLAYCSIEHMGIISIGLGIGGPIGIFGAIFHLFNHALTKSYLFFGAGDILTKYKTRKIDEVKGIITIMPITGTLFMLGLFALTGNPPFSIFASELTIINAMIAKMNYLAAVIFILALIMVFAGFVSIVTKMVFGKVDQSEHPEHLKPGEISKINICVMVALLIIMIYIGIIIPPWFNTILTTITALFLEA